MAASLPTAGVEVVGNGPGTPPERPPAWKGSASLSVKETYDSNIHLQSVTPWANQASLVTTCLPVLGVGWAPSPRFQANASYVPEFTFFEADSEEDFALHRLNLGLSGRESDLTYDLTQVLSVIDGSDVGPTWMGPGGAPAAGGIPIRDRRDAAIYRGQLKVVQGFGVWRVRPVVTAYVHDFQTRQSGLAGYQNYVDRNEYVGGLDVGRAVGEAASAWVGYRYGSQGQSALLNQPNEYDSRFHRVLLGFEGAVADGLKANVSLGPEVRRYGEKVPAAFGDRDVLYLFVDATLTATVTKADTITLSFKQFELPGFGGPSAFLDATLDLGWRHRFSSRWTVGAGSRAYHTDFLAPVVRNDWILSGNGWLNCTVTKALGAEVSYGFESAISKVPHTEGREFDRHLVSLGLRYQFQ